MFLGLVIVYNGVTQELLFLVPMSPEERSVRRTLRVGLICAALSVIFLPHGKTMRRCGFVQFIEDKVSPLLGDSFRDFGEGSGAVFSAAGIAEGFGLLRQLYTKHERREVAEPIVGGFGVLVTEIVWRYLGIGPWKSCTRHWSWILHGHEVGLCI